MLAKRAGFTGEITAIDISDGLVAMGRRYAEAESVSHRITFHSGDAHRSNLEGGFETSNSRYVWRVLTYSISRSAVVAEHQPRHPTTIAVLRHWTTTARRERCSTAPGALAQTQWRQLPGSG